MDFKPLSPLTGEDNEWGNVREYGESPSWQNKRRSSVFKNADGTCYDIDGKVFWEWCMPYEEGDKPYKSYYTNRDSRVPVTFPYIVPDKPIYEYRHSEATPQQPPVNTAATSPSPGGTQTPVYTDLAIASHYANPMSVKIESYRNMLGDSPFARPSNL